MTIDKTTIATSHFGTELIHAAHTCTRGSVRVLELTFADATTCFVKVGPHSILEIGGTHEMGTGTTV
jgi:hypothetical protein